MSDVEKTTSGEISEKSSTTAAAAAATLSSACAAAITVKQQQQHYQQQRQQYQQQQHSHFPAKASAANNVEVESCATLEHADDVSTISTPSLTRHCLSQALKALFSTPGLVLLVILYSVMGALLFPLLEAPQDITKSVAIAKSREDCLRELWIITEKLNVLYERNWTMLVHEQLRRFEGSIVAATRHGGLSVTSAGLDNNALAGRFGGQMDALLDARWTFSEALLYSVTVITTIGHGSLTPKTSAGKVATILYALIGVPLMLMCLSSLGALLAEALQCTYAKICCRLARSGRGSTQQNTARQRCESVDCDDDVAGCAAAEHRSVTEAGHLSGEYPEQAHELNCKSFKYDAVIGETNPNNGYDYNVNGAAMARAEESCQLLHNSSMSVNHVSPCMQLKSATMGANVQFYQQRGNNAYMQQPQQQQKQQQQHQQHSPYEQPQQQQYANQHSDVMHMSSACADAPTASNSSLLSQKFSQPSTSTPTTYCSRSATPSPQHLQHPLQQNYHIVTSSTHSSPTHTGYVRQNPMQQHQLHHHHLQQHFVAVPSNVVRFQTTAAAAAGAAPSKSDMLNFYQPASVAVTGSATIYFPISAATSATTTTVAATGAHGTQLLYNQPLVKYHTIQLQHKKPPLYVVADGTVPSASQQGHVTFATATTTTAATCGTLPLPPPPAYQTATVHGLRRAKFLTKPMPQGINTLMAENDGLSCRHDMSQDCNTSALEPSTSTASSAHSTLSTLSTPSLCSATIITTTSIPTRGIGLGMPTTATTMPTTASLGHTTAVDIMEDEEENEQHRMGNCPHGTPSRVPLISGAGNDDNAYSSDSKGKEGSAAKSSGILSRGLMNSTAASFHRHTLHTFHRSGNRKSSTAARRCCTLHRSHAGRAAMLSGSSGGCYGDTTETSDDDDYLAHGSTDFVLSGGGEEEGEESEDDDACNRHRLADGPQVPITIVLLILICYICLGTVIFAFWENWSLIDGAYFCFVTLSTIGYGDFLPERTFNGPEVQLFACCAYLLLGLVLVAMSFSILETQLMWKCKRIAVRLKLAKD